jgi:hypothetical protein
LCLFETELECPVAEPFTRLGPEKKESESAVFEKFDRIDLKHFYSKFDRLHLKRFRTDRSGEEEARTEWTDFLMLTNSQ